jgi:hypothetical protein
METKVCRACKEGKPLYDFSKRRSSPDGLDYRCRACASIEKALYYKENLDKIRAKKKEDRKNNPEKFKEKDRARYKRNSEKAKAHAAARRKDHPEEVRARKKKYYEENREAIIGKQKKYYEENKEKLSASGRCEHGLKAGCCKRCGTLRALLRGGFTLDEVRCMGAVTACQFPKCLVPPAGNKQNQLYSDHFHDGHKINTENYRGEICHGHNMLLYHFDKNPDWAKNYPGALEYMNRRPYARGKEQ